jgi:hypothetical protein
MVTSAKIATGTSTPTDTSTSPTPTPTTSPSPGAELCIGLKPDEKSIKRGGTANWEITVSAKNGSVTSVKLALTAGPKGLKPTFKSGCVDSSTGDDENGKPSCTIGTVGPSRQLTAQVPVPTSATFVKSTAQLVVTGTGGNLSPGPQIAAPVTVTAPSATASPSPSSSAGKTGTTGTAGTAGSGSASPSPNISQPSTGALPAGGFPFLGGGGSVPSLNPGDRSLAPGGNASSLFPTLNPGTSSGGGTTPRTRPVADTIPGDASVMGAQYAGLGALVLAFVLSVTRLSIRRRQASAKNGPADLN